MDNLISRKALKEAFNADVTNTMQTWNTDLLQLLMLEIDEAPAVDAEPVRHGVWLDVDYVYFGPKSYVCSLCKDEKYWMERYHYSKENYCPNCGAKMDGGKDINAPTNEADLY